MTTTDALTDAEIERAIMRLAPNSRARIDLERERERRAWVRSAWSER